MRLEELVLYHSSDGYHERIRSLCVAIAFFLFVIQRAPFSPIQKKKKRSRSTGKKRNMLIASSAIFASLFSSSSSLSSLLSIKPTSSHPRSIHPLPLLADRMRLKILLFYTPQTHESPPFRRSEKLMSPLFFTSIHIRK